MFKAYSSPSHTAMQRHNELEAQRSGLIAFRFGVVLLPPPPSLPPLASLPSRTQTMALLSSFLDKHYPHDEMIKQRKKQKGISVSSSSELLPLKSILEVLLNKSMRPDPYVIIDDQV
jgi:hypothetical protein